MTETRTRTKIDDLKAMFRQEGIQFSREEGWKELEEHVEVHQYHLGQQLNRTISWDDAVYSWYETVLTPLKRVVSSWEFRQAFPRQPLGDLYLAVSDHWHYLKERDPQVTPEEAARSFAMHYGKGLARWFSRFLIPANR
jgi:hypothetical protein